MMTLLEYLIIGNHLGRGSRRRAVLGLCGCKALVVKGLDDVTCAFERKCDPDPVNALGEVVALAEGRRTVALVREGSGFVVDRRGSDHIEYRPAGTTKRQDVLRDHRCGSPPPPPAQLTPSTFAQIAIHLPPGATPPF